MPSPQPVGSLRRPPVIATGSSSSSLGGSEEPIPAFQNFIKQTLPIVEDQKPLPPAPRKYRRGSSSSPPRSRSSTPSHHDPRRSSSVYSRTVSQWGSRHTSWSSADFADEPLPPMPILHPLAYSASSPQLVERSQTPQPLQPRTYSPIIATPSPTRSQVTMPSTPSHERLTHFRERTPAIQKQPEHIGTVSLEEAIAAINGPGAIHFLPEELRAKAFRKSRSDEALRLGASIHNPSVLPQEPLEPPTLIDVQGRRRTLLSPKVAPSFTSDYFPSDIGGEHDAQTFFKVGGGPARYMVSLASQERAASKDKVVQALGLDEFDEPRGRTRQRGPRQMDYTHYMPNVRRKSPSLSPGRVSEAQKIAKEYHALLSEQCRNPSNSSAYHHNEIVTADMKLLPHPLFQSKLPARSPGHLQRSDQEEALSRSPLNSRSGSASEDDRNIMPFKLSPSSENMHRRRSTSGSIPISPPQPMYRMAILQSPKRTSTEFKKTSKPSRKAKDSRVSAYYPHVASRKGANAKRNGRGRTKNAKIPPMPFLSEDVRQQNENIGEFSTSPSIVEHGSYRGKSDTTSRKRGQPLHRHLAKYTDMLTRPELPDRDDYEPITSATLSPDSPHLSPSPVTPKSKEIHLGWSEVAKSTFDRVMSPGTFQHKGHPKGEATQFVHIAAPARPLDESNMALKESEPPRRKSSIFGGLLDSWKESKAEKRREELKKIIRFVPPGEGYAGRSERENSSTTDAWM